MSAVATSPTPTDRPSRVVRLVGLVRRLIDYGRELAATLHQRAAADLLSVACNFGTRDLTLILASITRGLLRAARPGSEAGAECRPTGRRTQAQRPAGPAQGAA